jgi:RNA polymerase sigma factor (sigma-70 family)
MTTWDDTARSRDDALLDRVRLGDTAAFGELWRHHAGSALSVARGFRGLDPDDIVAETFEKLLRALRKGKGPTGAFRPYLIASVRNVARDHYRSRRESADDDLELVVDERALSGEQAAMRSQAHEAAAEAFQSMPERWREALWYSEVDGLPPRQLSDVLGVSPNGVSALVLRAKRGFRDAWVSAQLARTGSDECRPIVPELGAYTRDALSARDRKRVDQHLSTCESCPAALTEAKSISQTLALVLLPVVAGTAGAATYLSSAPAPSMPLALGAGVSAAADPGGARPGARPAKWRLMIAGAAAALLLLVAAAVWGIAVSSSRLGAESPGRDSVPGAPASPAPGLEPDSVPGGEAEETEAPTPSPMPTGDDGDQPVSPAVPGRPNPTPPVDAPADPAASFPARPPLGIELPVAPTATVSQSDSRMFPVISGTDAAPGALISLIGDAGQAVGETRADAFGRWTARATGLAPGRGELRAVQSVAGVTSTFSAAMPYAVDEPPRPTSPAESATVDAARFAFRLSAPAGTVIQRMLPGSDTVQTLTVPASGTWNEYLTVPAGESTIRLRYADPQTRDFGPWSSTRFIAN